VWHAVDELVVLEPTAVNVEFRVQPATVGLEFRVQPATVGLE